MNPSGGFKVKISKNRDLLVSVSVALVLVILSISLGFIDSYNKLSLDSAIIEVFGTLLGLSITSLGIVMTLLPHLDTKLLGSDTFDDVVNHFLYMIISEVAIIIVGLLIYSFYSEPTSSIRAFLIIFQLFLSFLSALMIVYATLYLYYLFKAIKKQRLEKG
ncbi:MAG: hypothetical protein QXL94_03755 [Candidatus Parvarchaeum sp.]